jgi:hypothetical protein
MVERVESGHGVHRAGHELDLGEVGVEEVGSRDSFASSPQLLLGEIDSRELKPLREPGCLRRAAAATELDHPGALGEPRDELVAPLGPRVAGDPLLPRFPSVGHGVIAGADELRARVAHSTSTSSSRAAASARWSASTDVSAVAIT